MATGEKGTGAYAKSLSATNVGASDGSGLSADYVSVIAPAYDKNAKDSTIGAKVAGATGIESDGVTVDAAAVDHPTIKLDADHPTPFIHLPSAHGANRSVPRGRPRRATASPPCTVHPIVGALFPSEVRRKGRSRADIGGKSPRSRYPG